MGRQKMHPVKKDVINTDLYLQSPTYRDFGDSIIPWMSYVLFRAGLYSELLHNRLFQYKYCV